jgi:hypothetical protein
MHARTSNRFCSRTRPCSHGDLISGAWNRGIAPNIQGEARKSATAVAIAKPPSFRDVTSEDTHLKYGAAFAWLSQNGPRSGGGGGGEFQVPVAILPPFAETASSMILEVTFGS